MLKTLLVSVIAANNLDIGRGIMQNGIHNAFGRVSGEPVTVARNTAIQPLDRSLDRALSAPRLQGYLEEVVTVAGAIRDTLRKGQGCADLPRGATVTGEYGSRVVSMDLGSGTVEVTVPPQHNIVDRAFEFVGLASAEQPVTCSLKDSSGEVLLEMTLQPADAPGKQVAAISRFGEYSQVQYDDKLNMWVGKTKESNVLFADALRQDQELLLHRDSSWEPKETIPQEALSNLEYLTSVMLSGLSSETTAVSASALVGYKRPAVALGDLPEQSQELGMLVKNVSSSLGDPAGLGDLARRYPRAQISQVGNSITIPLSDPNTAITISAPPPQGIITRIANFVRRSPVPETLCIVKAGDAELLRMTLGANGEPRLDRCAGFTNLRREGNVYKGTDPALQESDTRRKITSMVHANLFNPFESMRVSNLLVLPAATRSLAASEVERVSTTLADTIGALKLGRASSRR